MPKRQVLTLPLKCVITPVVFSCTGSSWTRWSPRLALLVLGLWMAFIPHGAWAHDGSGIAVVNPETYTGLVQDAAWCGNGGYRLAGTTLCTHGPDNPPTVEQIRADHAWMAAAPASSILCAGDGVSGQRVQVMYVRTPDEPEPNAQMLNQIRSMTAAVDAIFETSARETNGHRRIRFVTTADCQLAILTIELPAKTVRTWAATVAALQTLGYDDPKRKYLLFVDADVYCGISTIKGDSQPGGDNANNQQVGYARVDRTCWSATTAAHELTHTLGGVQNDAPHTTGAWHCTDENDLMCYADVSGTAVMVILCTDRRHADLLDCDHDDYFNTNPSPNNYLYNHWNVANSSFLWNLADDHPAVATINLTTTTGVATVAPTTTMTLTLTTTSSTTVLHYIQSVTYFQDGILVGEVTQAPYGWAWPGAATPGTYQLTTELHTTDDMVIALQPLWLTVKDPNVLDQRLYFPVVQK